MPQCCRDSSEFYNSLWVHFKSIVCLVMVTDDIVGVSRCKRLQFLNVVNICKQRRSLSHTLRFISTVTIDILGRVS